MIQAGWINQHDYTLTSDLNRDYLQIALMIDLDMQAPFKSRIPVSD